MRGRWTNPSLPETLQGAVMLLYVNAAFALLAVRQPEAVPILLGVPAGYGIANEKKWGYWLGIAVAVLDVASLLRARFVSVISLLFAALLVYLLLAPRSREHARIWFK